MRYLFTLIILAAMAGCSTAPELIEFENSRVYNKPRSEVWQKLSTFFQSASIPVQSKNPENGVLIAERKLQRGSIYANCGTSDIASIRDGVLTVTISLKSEGAGKTRAIIDVKFTAFRLHMGLTRTRIACFSNGTLEEEILKNL